MAVTWTEMPLSGFVVYDDVVWNVIGIISTSGGADYMALSENERGEFWDLDDVLSKGTFFNTREAAVAHLEGTSDE